MRGRGDLLLRADLGPEAIELVYMAQLDGLASAIENAERISDVATLEPSGWFWSDFPDSGWAEAVRKLPSEDAGAFERTMRKRIRDAIGGESSAMHAAVDRGPAERLLAIPLPEHRESPPVLPPGKAL